MTDEEEENRLNLLPDCLLLEIISRIKIKDKYTEEERLMSTKEVIKTTSTISKRWQHLWTRLPTLAFVCHDDILPYYYQCTDLTDYFSFIDNTLSQYPTDINLNKFKLAIRYSQLVSTQSKSHVYSWIRHAITRNVQEVDLLLWDSGRIYTERISYDDDLFFNNSCFTSLQLSHCVFNPPNGTIRWDKLKCLSILNGRFDKDSMGNILSGSPALETLELKECFFDGSFTKSLFRHFVVERLSADVETYELLTNGDERFWERDLYLTTMKLSRCVFSPRNGWGNLKFLCLWNCYKCDEDSFGRILLGSPCLETLELRGCYGVRRVDLASISVKNLVIMGYGRLGERYIDTLEIDAPNILSLTVKERMCLEKIVLLNISSLVKAVFDYKSSYTFARELRRTVEDIEEELLKGLLTNLGHVNNIRLENDCLRVFSRLKKRPY